MVHKSASDVRSFVREKSPQSDIQYVTVIAYLDAITAAKNALIDLRAHLVVVDTTADAAPDFSPLTANSDMHAILEQRWIECTKCVSVKAHLAAIVMMGGLVEALFVARAGQLTDKSILFRTKLG